MKTTLKNQVRRPSRAFTLIELLVVISIIAVLAALTLSVLGGVTKQRKIATAKAEMAMIQSALENYKAKYGTYPPSSPATPVANQLFYELSGVTLTTNAGGALAYQTLDGLYSVPASSFKATFGGVGGVINCSKGSGEDVVTAKNFLLGLKPTQITAATNDGNLIAYLATSVEGPDKDYHPAYGAGFTFEGNPFRYAYPGTNNPGSYDLWVQLAINSTASSPKHYLICNWSSQVQVNSLLP